MKIAIAFFGLPRASSICFPSIQQKILDHLPSDAEVKHFYHFYKQDRVINPRSGENDVLADENYEPFRNFVGTLELPGSHLIQSQYEKIALYGDAWQDDGQSLKNLIHQLHSLYAVTEMMNAFDPDVVIFLRPDLLFHDALPQGIVEAAAIYPSTVFLPGWQSHKGYNDRFAVCGKLAYKHYGGRVGAALNFCASRSRTLHSERLLKFSLDNARCFVYPLQTRACRVRVGGAVVNERFYQRIKLSNGVTWLLKYLLLKILVKCLVIFPNLKHRLGLARLG